MSRLIRLYEKKRGERRTGSTVFGSLGEALFFGLFLVIGCAAFAYMWGWLVWPEWRANRQFAPADCTILSGKVATRPAADGHPATYRPEFAVRYTIDGETYEVDQVYEVTGMYSTDEAAVRAIVDSFEPGKQYSCWYDPLDPSRVVLARGYSGWIYLLLLIPLSFIVIGGSRMVFALLQWNSSAERRALLVQKATQLDLFETSRREKGFPSVPADANLTNSPGTTLAYRLPIATAAGWKLFAVAAACLLWNGIVIVFLIMLAGSFARGEPDWILAGFLTPFVIGGVVLLVYLVRQILITTGVGPTRIEISKHPLTPGQPYDIFLSQAGRLAMNSLELWLACDEKATYRQGTDTRIETRRVYEERCFVRQEFEIHQGLPFESRCTVRVPTSAMHSFHANHNEVSWKLIVKGRVVGWPDYQRVFHVVVNPAAAVGVNGNNGTNGHAR